jgi:sulfate transport system permease protein
LGVTTLWLSVIVLLPLAAMVSKAFSAGPAQFQRTISTPGAAHALYFTIVVSAVVAAINTVFGTVIAWVLVRDEFPGKGLVNALIDLPFALPTIVASVVLLALYGPHSPVGVNLVATEPGVALALLFVTLPFVVRSVQPVLMELDTEAEQAAASLGASNWVTFRRVVLPALAPALFSGAGLAFARALGEYGSVVLIGGGIPRETEVASQYIAKQIEIDRPQAAAAVSVTLLVISFLVLFLLRLLAARAARAGGH